MGRRGRKGGKGYLSLENHSSNHQRNQLCSPVNNQEDSTGEMCDIFLGLRQPTCRKQPSSAGTGKERLCSAGVHSLTVTASDLESQMGPRSPLPPAVQLRTTFTLYPAHFFMSRLFPLRQKNQRNSKPKKITSTWPP